MKPSNLVVVEDLELGRYRVKVECPECQGRANRVLSFGPRGQAGPRVQWRTSEHQLWPCGCRTAKQVLFDMSGRP